MHIEYVSEPEKPSQPLPIDERVIVKLPKGTLIYKEKNEIFDAVSSALYITTDEFVNKLANSLVNAVGPKEIFGQGVRVEILEPGKKWVIGNLRLRLVFEFIPDDAEFTQRPPRSLLENQTTEPPLDDIRCLIDREW